MCGRFAQVSPLPKLSLKFEAVIKSKLPARYNVAPQQKATVLYLNAFKGMRRLEEMTWGLMPAWMANKPDAHPLINARAETITEKPSFKEAYLTRRCLIPVDGFYEWKSDGETKQPYYFMMKDAKPFALAGLWDSCEKDKKKIVTFTVITTAPNELMSEVHDRMPVIVGMEDVATWLDPGLKDTEILKRFLRSFSSDVMTMRPVSSYVNNAKNEGPECIQSV